VRRPEGATDSEVLFICVDQGKRVLRSMLLSRGVSELSGLLEHLWQAGLTEVWVMPATDTLTYRYVCLV